MLEAKDKLEQRVAERTKTLEYIAVHDSLTGLLNRSAYCEYFDKQVLARKDKGPVTGAVVVLDLDNFKLINDSHGHSVGDAVLKVVAERLKESVKDSDLLIRLGGDEFALVLFDLKEPIKEAKIVCERLKESISKPIATHHLEVRISCSAGICALKCTAGNNTEMLNQAIANADIALYKAKDIEGAFCAAFEKKMGVEVAYRQQLENDLRIALETRQIYAMFQPQVLFSNQQLVGIEALARWKHPLLGDIPPDNFIPIAEECGLIDELCAQMLDQSCQAVADIMSPVHCHDNVHVAVNFSVAQFYNPNLLTVIQDVLSKYNLTPSALEIEITESLFIKNPQHAKEILGQMREIGLRIALDDFGTGYSALGYLKEFDVDTIKLDRSFVQSITSRQADLRIVEGIIKLAKSLKLNVVAEGVETKEQGRVLRNLHCDIAQGYFYGRPMSFEQLKHQFLTPQGQQRNVIKSQEEYYF